MSSFDWDSLQASDKLDVRIPGWLAREKYLKKTRLHGFVSWQTGKAIWFVQTYEDSIGAGELFGFAGWLPKSVVEVLDPDVAQEERCRECQIASGEELPPCAEIAGDSVCDGFGNIQPK